MRTVTTFILLSCFLACAHPAADHSKAPFELVFLRNTTWNEGKAGFDPSLPGFHLVGGVGEVLIRKTAPASPESLVLVIRTSPALPPNLESFRLTTTDSLIEYTGGSTRATSLKTGTTGIVQGSDYFVFDTIGNNVHVTILQRGIDLLGQECTIRWVDWYRE